MDPFHNGLQDPDPFHFDLPDPDPFHETDLDTDPGSNKSAKIMEKKPHKNQQKSQKYNNLKKMHFCLTHINN